MKYLGLLTLFLGYLLIYAATANHGRFALHPWTGLVGDAYTGDVIILPKPGSSSSGGTTEVPSPEGPVPEPNRNLARLQPATLLGAAA